MEQYIPNENKILHKTQVDLTLSIVQKVIYLVQYDKSLPVIEVELFNNNEKYYLPSSIDVYIRWGKFDHTYVRKMCMVSENRHFVYFEVDYQMTYFHGQMNPILELVSDGSHAGTSSIPVTVNRNPVQNFDEESAVDDEFIYELYAKVDALEAKVDELMDGCEVVLEAKKNACLVEIQEKTDQCKNQLEVKTSECIASIPSDYTALTARVTALEENYDRYEWDIMLQAIRNGHGDNYHTGDQLLINWRDHTNNVNYNNVEHNIVDHTNAIVKINDVEQTVPALTLEWHYTIPFGLAFDPQEAMAQVGANGMPAGTYYFKVAGDSWGGNNGKYYKFTLVTDLVAGNHLRPTNSYNALMSTGKMNIYADGKSFDALYSLDIVETDSTGEGAIYLGTLWSTSDVGFAATYLAQDSEHSTYLNHYHRIVFGYNRWRDSLYRQWLNAEGTGWWIAQNIFDRAPSNINTLQGFLTGYSSQFKNVLRPTKTITYRNTVTDDGGYDITYDKIFLRSMANMNVDGFNTQQNSSGLEGPAWEYYKNLAIGQENLNANGTFKAWQTYSILIKYALNAKTSAQYVFSRAAHRDTGHLVLNVHASGHVNDNGAINGYRCLPACIIS